VELSWESPERNYFPAVRREFIRLAGLTPNAVAGAARSACMTRADAPLAPLRKLAGRFADEGSDHEHRTITPADRDD